MMLKIPHRGWPSSWGTLRAEGSVGKRGRKPGDTRPLVWGASGIHRGSLTLWGLVIVPGQGGSPALSLATPETGPSLPYSAGHHSSLGPPPVCSTCHKGCPLPASWLLPFPEAEGGTGAPYWGAQMEVGTCGVILRTRGGGQSQGGLPVGRDTVESRWDGPSGQVGCLGCW